jgi:hypothetical protein
MNSRININNNAPTHTDANRYLTDLMIDLKKKVLLQVDYQPFTLERLNEWDSFRENIYECWDGKINKHTGDPQPEHIWAEIFFTELIHDLKNVLQGHVKFEDWIDEARIVEAEKYWAEIVHCRKRRMIFY